MIDDSLAAAGVAEIVASLPFEATLKQEHKVRGGLLLRLDMSGTEVFCKVSETAARARDISHEISVLRQLASSGASIPRVLAEGSRAGNRWFVMSLVEGLHLRALFADTPREHLEATARGVWQATRMQLDRIHGRGFVHGDLQPAHVFVSGRTVSIIDFGQAAPPGESFAGGLVSMLPPSAARELLTHGSITRTEELDSWQLAVSVLWAVRGGDIYDFDDEGTQPGPSRWQARLEAIADGRFADESLAERASEFLLALRSSLISGHLEPSIERPHK